MNFSLLRRSLPALSPALAVVAALAVGCTSGDGPAKLAVPSPGAEAAGLCRSLDEQLPQRVSGERRSDPEPESELTAGWGDPAIILRCGVVRPAKMDDVNADGIEVNGVGWLLEKQDNGSFRFTTTLRKAYVEVTIPEDRTSEGLAPLTDLVPAVKTEIPKGIASQSS